MNLIAYLIGAVLTLGYFSAMPGSSVNQRWFKAATWPLWMLVEIGGFVGALARKAIR